LFIGICCICFCCCMVALMELERERDREIIITIIRKNVCSKLRIEEKNIHKYFILYIYAKFEEWAKCGWWMFIKWLSVCLTVCVCVCVCVHVCLHCWVFNLLWKCFCLDNSIIENSLAYKCIQSYLYFHSLCPSVSMSMCVLRVCLCICICVSYKVKIKLNAQVLSLFCHISHFLFVSLDRCKKAFDTQQWEAEGID